MSETKPLFLKELSRVWAEYSQFDASNTLMLDNHAEKFERNPLHTCVLVPHFAFDAPADDDVLAPHGELTRLLRGMAAAPDVRVYAAATPSPLLLRVHPTPPPTSVSGAPNTAEPSQRDQSRTTAQEASPEPADNASGAAREASTAVERGLATDADRASWATIQGARGLKHR